MTRRSFASFLPWLAGSWALSPLIAQAEITLPKETCFIGERKFLAIVAKAKAQNWGTRPMADRMILIARELEGTPYVGFTLEIDDRIECPSANFNGLDCWTFFEIVLGLARMLETPKADYTWRDLLAEIEWTRYRGGRCTGGYLERIHYLDEWFFDNYARQNVWDFTRRLPGAIRLVGRRSTEMTTLWRSYRYLKMNPSLRAPMRALEHEVEKLPVYYVPKAVVRQAQPHLQNGDIIGIVTNQQGGVCSHVGLALRDKEGVLRFMHASKNHKAVVVDDELAVYLAKFRYHAGIMACRPLPTRYTIRDPKTYADRLTRLKAGQPPAKV